MQRIYGQLTSTIVIATLLFFVASGCTKKTTQEEKAELLKLELGLDSDSQLDYENIEHLVFLNKYATDEDKKFSAESVALAKKLMADGDNLFDRVQYEEAILSYPTPEIVLAFGNGFLRIAQQYLDKVNPDIRKRIGNNDVKWYFQGAAVYYKLAMDFSDRIDEAFVQSKKESINETIICINKSLKEPESNIENPCKVIEE